MGGWELHFPGVPAQTVYRAPRVPFTFQLVLTAPLVISLQPSLMTAPGRVEINQLHYGPIPAACRRGNLSPAEAFNGSLRLLDYLPG